MNTPNYIKFTFLNYDSHAIYANDDVKLENELHVVHSIIAKAISSTLREKTDNSRVHSQTLPPNHIWLSWHNDSCIYTVIHPLWLNIFS